jgi:hypothetical protein
MMTSKTYLGGLPPMPNAELDSLVMQYGTDAAIELLKREMSRRASESILTIVANEGAHHLPEAYKRGEVYVATRGNLDFSSVEKVRSQYEKVIVDLARKLKSKTWHRVYLIPFGHSTLCMQIKLLVYRVTRIETVDLFYDGRGNYADLSIEQRSLIVETPP